MQSEPIARLVGDSQVRIDDVITGLAEEHRLYWFRVTKPDGITTVYRCKVLLSDVIRLNDQQLTEYLLRRGRRVRLFAFRGEAIP